MPYQGTGATLLAYDSEGSAATNQSATFQLSSQDNTPEDQVFSLLGSLVQANGATSPTAMVTVSGSIDNENWATVGTFNTDGTTESASSVSTITGFKYMKVDLVVAGGTAPSVVASVQVASTSPFTATDITP